MNPQPTKASQQEQEQQQPKQVLIFANPIAGRGRGRGVAQRITRRLEKDQFQVHLFQKPADEIEDSELRAAGAGGSSATAITIGGDGTIRAAVQRLLRFVADDATKVPPIAVVPLGTANLMARHLRLRWRGRTLEEDVAAAIQRRSLVMLDAARANGQLFLLMAGVGLDASVIHELDRARKGPIDVTSYTLPLLSALRSYEFPPLRVEVDGRLVSEPIPSLVFVGNVPEYGTGFPILTRAQSDDRLLDVCVLPCRAPTEVMRMAMLTTTGDHLFEEGVVYTKGRSVRVESAAAPVPIQIDGEASGYTPLAVDLLPSGVRFIVPA